MDFDKLEKRFFFFFFFNDELKSVKVLICVQSL
jgi:hypothetical protein